MTFTDDLNGHNKPLSPNIPVTSSIWKIGTMSGGDTIIPHFSGPSDGTSVGVISASSTSSV